MKNYRTDGSGPGIDASQMVVVFKKACNLTVDGVRKSVGSGVVSNAEEVTVSSQISGLRGFVRRKSAECNWPALNVARRNRFTEQWWEVVNDSEMSKYDVVGRDRE